MVINLIPIGSKLADTQEYKYIQSLSKAHNKLKSEFEKKMYDKMMICHWHFGRSVFLILKKSIQNSLIAYLKYEAVTWILSF